MDTPEIQLDRLVPTRLERLLAVEPNADGTATLYQRSAAGDVVARNVPFRPWLLTAGRQLAERLPNVVESVHLDAGNGPYDWRVHFADVRDYRAAVTLLRNETGSAPSDPRGPYKLITDLTQQILSVYPARLFRKMTFSDVRRLQLDIETVTTPGFDFPNPEREGDRIVIVSLRDTGGWEACLSGPEMTEAEILAETIRLIRERDPDVIEGHNIFDFDLTYIETRCRRHGIRLALGRDGSAVSARSSRFTAAERTSAYRRYDIYGRHVVDTLQLTRLYDVVHRELDSYGLKYVARHFGVAAPERTYVKGDAISALYESDPERLRAYAMDDVRETAAISNILAPSYFYQAQLVPFSYQNCVTRGNAARIEAVLVAEYVRRGAAIPQPMPQRPFRGGLTESQKTGIFDNVWHLDIRSLYPSILISRERAPTRDSQGVFLKFLRELRHFRLAMKDAARSSSDRGLQDYYNSLQSSFKILLNSFYGYLGFAQASFNDYELAEDVTAEGRRILRGMVDYLDRRRAKVIELDTDGIYFVPPPDIDDPETLERDVQGTLPRGIEVDMDATYDAMFSYKSKNYALLTRDREVAVTGAALKSRGLEPFQRRYMKELIALLLTRRENAVADLFRTYADAIVNHRLPLADFAKREVLSSPPRVYAEKLAAGTTRRSAAYELALKSAREYNQGDQVAYYITGDRKNVAVCENAKLLSEADEAVRDENVPYYLDKLKSLHAKFKAFIPSEQPLFPNGLHA